MTSQLQKEKGQIFCDDSNKDGVKHYSMFARRHLWTAPYGEGK